MLWDFVQDLGEFIDDNYKFWTLGEGYDKDWVEEAEERAQMYSVLSQAQVSAGEYKVVFLFKDCAIKVPWAFYEAEREYMVYRAALAEGLPHFFPETFMPVQCASKKRNWQFAAYKQDRLYGIAQEDNLDLVEQIQDALAVEEIGELRKKWQDVDINFGSLIDHFYTKAESGALAKFCKKYALSDMHSGNYVVNVKQGTVRLCDFEGILSND